MTIPSKPDLVALADLLAAIEPVQDWTAQIHPKPEKYDRYVAALTEDQRDTIVQVLRHLASQPSLYEAGLRDMREDLADSLMKDEATRLRKLADELDPPAIAALPADGGEESGGRAVIEGDAVVIRFPLDAMQTAMDGAWSLRAFDTRYKITDINEFAKEFRNALNREDERGTTEIHKMADRAFIDCIESGAFGIEEHEQQGL